MHCSLHGELSVAIVPQVPVAIGGKGLPEGAKFADDVKDAGLTNVTATIINLLGFVAPEHMRPTLLAPPDTDGKRQRTA